MKSSHTLINSQKGQSLIQALIGIGIMGIMMTVLLTMSVNQNRQIQNLQEKLARSDFQQQVTRSFSDGTLCSMLLMDVTFTAPGGVLASSSPGRQALAFSTSPPSIPVSTVANAPTLATAGMSVSPISNSLIVSAVDPFVLTNIIGSSNGTSGTFTANFQINFDSSKLVQSLLSASTQVVIYTSSSGDTQTIKGCTIAKSDTPPIHMQTYTTHGNYTFTVPMNINWLHVRVVGAGGGGAGTNGKKYSGGGGGSGGYSEGWIAVTPGQIIPLVVGRGGMTDPAVGAPGGSTSFGTYMSATGGEGGTSTGPSCAGGSPGLGSGGQMNLSGGSGGDGNPFNNAVQGGTGGASIFGGGGRSSTTPHGDSDGVAPGSGGGGGWSNGPASTGGGNGADGAVFISW